jgi:hypothetical protein
VRFEPKHCTGCNWANFTYFGFHFVSWSESFHFKTNTYFE